MSKKIEIIGKSLRVTETIGNVIEISEPQGDIWYKESDLKNGRIIFYDKNGTEDVSGTNFNPINLTDAVDASLVAFTESTFRTFCTTNLGFKSVELSTITTADIFSGGFADYNDLATQSTPLIVTVPGSPVALTNDGLGAFTNKTYLPTGVTDVWDTSTNMFDWSDLSLGDMVDIRLDIDLITASPNTEIKVDLHLGTGGGAYTIPFITDKDFKNVGTHKENRFNGIYMGDANTLNNGGKFMITTDKDCTLKVNGWYVKIIQRG